MSKDHVAALESVMDRMGLNAKALSPALDETNEHLIPEGMGGPPGGDACAWELTLAAGLQAELMLTITSDDDHLLSLVMATEAAHDMHRWHALDAFGETVSTLVRPVRMLRRDAELGCQVQARAQHPEALANLLVELVVLTRRTTMLVLQPWVALARGEIDFDTAIVRVAASVEPMPEQGFGSEGPSR